MDYITTIDELIAALQKAKAEHGNALVGVDDADEGSLLAITEVGVDWIDEKYITIGGDYNHRLRK